jgi:hypothetical protein
MEQNVCYLPDARNTKKAISVLLQALTETLDYPEATLTVAAVVPLLTVILELSGKLEERMSMLSQRLAICETALSSSSSGGLIPSKSASCAGLSQ